MAKYYQISNQQIVIKPLKSLAPIGIVIMVFMLLLPTMILLMAVNGKVGDITSRNLATCIIVLPFILACIPFFTYSCRQIIFDATTYTVYKKTVWGSKALMQFNEVAGIVVKTSFGQSYYLKSKADRYGEGYRVSPVFSGDKDKAKQEYESVVLPAVNQMLRLQPQNQSANNHSTLYDQVSLNYYQENAQGYLLKPVGSFKLLPGAIFLGLGATYMWYNLVAKHQGDKAVAIILTIMFIFITATFFKRIVFNLSTHQVVTYYLGFPLLKHNLSSFAGFNIVRKTTNGIYSGTDVRLKFTKENGKTEKELTLADFNKTNPIEPFINETELVINRAK